MNIKQKLQKWGLTNLKITVPFLETEWSPQEPDREAAWELYVEMLTRIATQPLSDDHGDEKAALESVYNLFGITREILRRKGRGCIQFSKIAVVVLNQIVRPFTAKWHKQFMKEQVSKELLILFRKELAELQTNLRIYTRVLADIAEVEDLTSLEYEH